jgi:hypothetical protein
MAAEACGNSLQQWLSLELGKRTRIDNATEENSTRWLERYYCDQDGASDDNALGNQPTYGPALWQVGKGIRRIVKSIYEMKKIEQQFLYIFLKPLKEKSDFVFFFNFKSKVR